MAAGDGLVSMKTFFDIIFNAKFIQGYQVKS